MSHTAVRRAALTSFAVNLFCLLAVILMASVIYPRPGVPASVVPEEAEDAGQVQPLALPMKIECTSLTVQTMAVYDGPFYEDGSGREVGDVAAVMVYNDSNSLIPYANIMVATENARLTFHAYMLPPRSVTLVPEAAAQPYSPDPITQIYGWHTVKQEQSRTEILIAEQNDTTLRIENHSGRVLRNLTVSFKKYIDGVYIGGRPFAFTVSELSEGKSVVLSAPCYVSGYSRILYYEEKEIPSIPAS